MIMSLIVHLKPTKKAINLIIRDKALTKKHKQTKKQHNFKT